jgi:hypothetical protein
LQEKLAMADAIIVATARAQNCKIISSDSDLKNQPNVDYIPKNSQGRQDQRDKEDIAQNSRLKEKE